MKTNRFLHPDQNAQEQYGFILAMVILLLGWLALPLHSTGASYPHFACTLALTPGTLAPYTFLDECALDRSSKSPKPSHTPKDLLPIPADPPPTAVEGKTPSAVPPPHASPTHSQNPHVSQVTLPDGTKIKAQSVNARSLGKGLFKVDYRFDLDPGQSYSVILQISPLNDTYAIQGVEQTLMVVPDDEVSVDLPRSASGQSPVDVYPLMSARLSGVGFAIVPEEASSLGVKWPDELVWSWTIMPRSAGHHELNLVLSIPISVQYNNRQVEANATLLNIIFPVNVSAEDTPTPNTAATPTAMPTTTASPAPAATATAPTAAATPPATPVPTATPTPVSLIAQIQGGIAEHWDGIIVAFIALAATLLAALTGLIGSLISALGTFFAALAGRPRGPLANGLSDRRASPSQRHSHPAREQSPEKHGKRKR